MAPDNRGPQAKGVGKNSKRHDMERREVPFLHGSDLQQGDVEAMRQGQRVAPVQTQRPAAPQPSVTGGGATSIPTDSGATSVPDPIQFFASRANGTLNVPRGESRIDNSRALSWLPILRQLAVGPGSSPALASAIINQARELQRHRQIPATIIDMNATDDALEAMLQEGV